MCSSDLVDKCKEKRLDIMLKDVQSECNECDLKCFNEKQIKDILADARASDAAFKTEIQRTAVVWQ